MKRIVLIAGMTFSSFAFSLLPPLHHSSNEIKNVLDNQKVQSTIGSQRAISSVKRTTRGITIETQDGCTLQVKRTHLPNTPGFVGPARFTYKAGKLTCKN